jgi:hypothetical protein
MNCINKRAVSVVLSLALAIGCLAGTAAAAEKEEELLRAVEEVVRQYRAEAEPTEKQKESAVEEKAAQSPSTASQPPSDDSAEKAQEELPKPAAPSLAPAEQSKAVAAEAKSPAAPPAEAIVPSQDSLPQTSQQNITADPPQQSADTAQKVQVEQSRPAGEINIWQQLAAGPPPMLPAAKPAGETAQAAEPAASAVIAKDDIILTIEEAIRQYRANDFARAISNLDYAAQLIRQKKNERMKSLLPAPLFGWQAKEASAKSLGTAVFGGGSTVSRDYCTNGGEVVSIEIVSDSPVLQSIIMMLNNPLFAGASGGNLQTIKGQRAIIKHNANDRSGEINIVVDSRFIVTVKGKAVDMTWLLRYADAMDFEALAKN